MIATSGILKLKLKFDVRLLSSDDYTRNRLQQNV